MRNILNKITHRGPDGTGIWASQDAKVILGHKRLSIVDLNQNANQPMIKENDNISIVFNGEIYNHRELRKELEHDLVQFETDHSDTEVLVNGYIHWGLEKLLQKLNGMFAFAIYDYALDKLFICRDRIGIKSLYYASVNGCFLFSSEIKGILAAKLFPPELDSSHLNEYLLFRSLTAPYTLFKNIKKLKPATFLVIDLSSLNYVEKEYWNPLDQEVDHSIKSQLDVETSLHGLINSSLDYRLEADVPVGMFLSGGVDSNYLLSQLANKRHGIKCFTASFPNDKGYDESLDAKYMANKFGAEYIDVPVEAKNYVDILEEMVYFQEEPISAPVSVPVYYLSKAAREQGVPVVLAGEGSDEIFVGYGNWIKLRKAQNLLNKIPFSSTLSKASRKFLSKNVNITSPVHDLSFRACHDLPIFWGGAMDINGIVRSQLLANGLSASDLNMEIYESSVKKNYLAFVSRRGKENVSSWMTYMDLKQRLPELMLPRLDRMGMAHSIEGRVPFLDHRLVEFMFKVPEAVMLENKSTGKSALKAIASESLGHEFVYRKKKGFQAPVSDWKDEEFKGYISHLEVFAERTGLFTLDGVRTVVKFGGRRFFTLVNFMLWYLIYIENVLFDSLPTLKRWDQY